MAASDIADALGVKPSAVSNWRSRYQDFPEPITSVAREHTPLWLKGDIAAWYRGRIAASDVFIIDPGFIKE